MIESVEVVNSFGESLTIELGAPEKTGLWVKSIKGIGPGKANINTTDLASSDGGIYNSARSEIRNITMTLGIVDYMGEDGTINSVEDVRRNLYRWFAKKRPINFIIHTDRIDLISYGYVESNEPDIFQKDETTSISIICPDPNMYLYASSEGLSFSSTEDAFEFPMAFVVTSDAEFQPEKLYYELIDDEYELTTDTKKLLGKTYYEEAPITVITRPIYDEEVCNEGYENPVDSEYFVTSDTVMQPGKEYFELVDDHYESTDDINEFVEGKTYYEYQSVTEFAKLIDIANKSTYYDGEIEIGLNIVIYITGEVSGLSIYKIYDRYNYDVMSFDDVALSLAIGSGLNAGDEIRVCTITGKKYAILIREAVEYNIMNALGKSPAWFQLDQGNNTFSYGAESGSGNVSVNIEYVRAYEGV